MARNPPTRKYRKRKSGRDKVPPPVGKGAPLRPVELLGAVLLVTGVVALNFMKTRNIVEVPRERMAREVARGA